MEEQHRPVPLEKREIKGLTAEAIIKYGTIMLLAFYSFYSIKTAAKTNADNILLLKERILVLEKKIETLEANQQATEIWKSRWDEKIKYVKFYYGK